MYRYRLLALIAGFFCATVLSINVISPLPLIIVSISIGLLLFSLIYLAILTKSKPQLNTLKLGEVHQTFTLLERAIDFEIDILSQEVQRACALIDAGTKGMSESFHQLREISEAQQKMLAKLVKAPSESTDNVTTSLANKEHLQQIIGQAIQTLQFEDITSQSLQSMLDNVNQLSLISAQLRGMSSSALPFEQQLVQLEEICKTFSNRKMQTAQHRTVSQENLDEGEIDLF